MVTIGVFCAVLLALMVGAEIRMFGFQFLAYYFLFYTLGYCLHKFELLKIMKGLSTNVSLGVLTLLWSFIAWGWTMHGLPAWVPAIPHVPAALLQYAYRGFSAMVAIIILIGITPQIVNGKTSLNTFVSGAGIISLGMYAGHLEVLGHFKDLVLNLYPEINLWIAVMIVSLLSFVVAFVMIRLLEKNKHTARIFLGKI